MLRFQASGFLTHPLVQKSSQDPGIHPGIRPGTDAAARAARTEGTLPHESQCCCPASRPRTAADLSQSRVQPSTYITPTSYLFHSF